MAEAHISAPIVRDKEAVRLVEREEVERQEIREETKNEEGMEIDLTETIRPLQRGMIVKGTVVQVDEDGAMVDVGGKAEGLLPADEISLKGKVEPREVLSVGDEVRVFVLKADAEESSIIVSKKRADFELAWQKLENAFHKGEILTAMVVDRVKGGILVDLGVQGFVPTSHLDLLQFRKKNPEYLIGQSIPLKILELDRGKGKVVLSHKIAVEEERQRKKEEILSQLSEGKVVQGVVKRLKDFGAFIDIGGIEGLLHISDISWSYIKHPREVLKPGQKIEVVVLKVDKSSEKISFGLKQLLADPWREAEKKYKVGDVVKGKVVRLVPTGAFVRLEEGIDAFLPLSQISDKKVKKPEEVLKKGDRVEAKVIDFQPSARRMHLSIKELKREREREKERQRAQEYMKQQKRTGPTIGDLAGDVLKKLKNEGKGEEEKQE
ncbi:30S ribosomal protein S1 [bacterium]|nr:30S ribosomal protein S1 [bacterium]